jgi:hypothetical protein
MNAVRNVTLDDDYRRAFAALERYRSLPENWDGAGAPKPSKRAIDAAMTVVDALQRAWFVPAPQVALMPNGGIQFAWRPVTKRGVLEIEARFVDEGDHELAIGYAHEPGFEVDDCFADPVAIAKAVRECFATKDT